MVDVITSTSLKRKKDLKIDEGTGLVPSRHHPLLLPPPLTPSHRHLSPPLITTWQHTQSLYANSTCDTCG